MTDVPTSAELRLSWRRRAIALRLSHREIDERANLPGGYFSKLVAGLKTPTFDTVLRVCRALELRLSVDNEIAALKCGDVSSEYCDSVNTQEDREHG